MRAHSEPANSNEFQLPEPPPLMTSKVYKTKYVEPLVSKLKALVKTVFAKYLKAVDARITAIGHNGSLQRRVSILSRENKELIKHYGLDEAKAWSFHRWSCPWKNVKKPLIIEAFKLKLERHPTSIQGVRFKNPNVNDVITFTHPITKVEHKLTVLEYEQQEFSSKGFDEKGVKAATYIEIPGAGAAEPPEEIIDFVVDRPFVFAITKDKLPLFTGVVNNL